MRHFFRNSCLLVLAWMSLAGTVWAVSSISDGDLIVTLRNGTPCFSYPVDDKTKKEALFFGMLSVSWNNREASLPPFEIWELQSGRDDYSPATPESCIEYGVLKPDTRQNFPAAAQQYNVPYRAHLTVFGRRGERKYLAYYCLRRNSGNETILLKAAFNKATSRYECVE